MAAPQDIKIGIVGAGANTKLRHIPALKKIPGVEIVCVCNRSEESSKKVADEFSIPRTSRHWREIVDDFDIDAVVIGTWPYLHCPITLAALDNNKHVLTEARMAMDAREAHLMLEASRMNPHLVSQIVPAPFTFDVDQTISRLLSSGTIGELLHIDMRILLGSFLNRAAPLNWRMNPSLSGKNMLQLGIWAESLFRWVGGASRVSAMGNTFVKSRTAPHSPARLSTDIAEHLDIHAKLICGASLHLTMSGITGSIKTNEISFFGESGTLRYLDGDLFISTKTSPDFQPVGIRQQDKLTWRVEEEFIDAIRGVGTVGLTTFEDGVRYMEFTEAVHRSIRDGLTHHFPLVII